MERIGILGDVHYINSKQELKQELAVQLKSYYIACLEYLKKETQTARFLSVGDIAHTGQKSEFLEFYDLIKSHGIDLSHVMGNHDLLQFKKYELTDLEYYRRDCLIREEEYDILFLDTAKEKKEEDWGGILNNSQLELLKKCVIESNQRLLIVVAHHPIFDTTYGSTDYLMSIEENAEINHILDMKVGQGIFVCGHTHLSSMVKKKNWSMIQAASIMNMNTIPFLLINHGEAFVVWSRIKDKELKEAGCIIGSSLKGYTYLSDKYLERGGEGDWENGDQTDCVRY